MSGDAARWLTEVDHRIAGVLESVRGESADWAVPDRLAEGDGVPHWFELPIWLDQAWAWGRPAPELADVLWGQYALFLFIRIQDDLLDRQRRDLDSMFVADRFLVESLAAFNRIPRLNADFREKYQAWLRDTVDGILEVRRLESIPGGFTAVDLSLHSKVCSIFKVGSLAICRAHGREREWPWIERWLDLLAVFSQIGDDLQDLKQDVESGRYTWPANVLSGGVPAAGFTPTVFCSDRSDAVLMRLREIAGQALVLIPPMAPAPVRALAQGLVGRVDQLERGLHEAAVRMVFGEILNQT